MRETEILFNNIPNLRDGCVPLYFVFSQLGALWCFSHDTVCDLIQSKKAPVGLTAVSFIGIHLLDGFFCMTAAGNTQGEIGAVMMGGRGHLGGKDKSIPGINGGMFLQTIMGFFIFHRPVRFEIPGKLARFPLFVQFALGGLSLLSFFLQLLGAEGMAGRLDQPGINGDAFVDGETLGGKL